MEQTPDLETRFKKLRRQVRAIERRGVEPDHNMLAELYGIDLVLSEELEGWIKNYEGGEHED